MLNQLDQTAIAAPPVVLLGLPDRLLLAEVVVVVVAAASQEQEPTRLHQQTACPLLCPTTSLAQVKTLAS